MENNDNVDILSMFLFVLNAINVSYSNCDLVVISPAFAHYG